jgi:hypothetical protein
MQTHQRLLHTWQAELARLLPEVRATQRRGFGLLVAGLLWAGTVNLTRIATELPLAATVPSIDRRLRRWLANEAIAPRALWQPLVPALLGPLAGPAPVFVLDPTDLPGKRRLLVLGLTLHRRVLPLAWVWAPSHQKWTKRLGTLVAQMTPAVSAAVPAGVVPTLIADAGLSGPRLLEACLAAGWHFVLRLPVNHNSSHQVRFPDGSECRLWDLVPGRGQHWAGAVDVFKGAGWVPVFLTIHWDRREDDPWILISDAVKCQTAVRCYRQRTHVEATFQDAKSRVWDLSHSRLAAAGRLARLVVALVVALWWAARLALSATRHGHRRHFDRRRHPRWGVVRLGRAVFRQRCRDGSPPPTPFIHPRASVQTVRQ